MQNKTPKEHVVAILSALSQFTPASSMAHLAISHFLFCKQHCIHGEKAKLNFAISAKQTQLGRWVVKLFAHWKKKKKSPYLSHFIPL